MDKMTKVESEVLALLIRRKLGDHSIYLAQIKYLTAEARVFTGKGFYTTFKLSCSSLKGDDEAFQLSTEGIDSSSFNRLMIGFAMFVEHGAVSMLEGYTFDSSGWPEDELLKINWSGRGEVATGGAPKDI